MNTVTLPVLAHKCRSTAARFVLKDRLSFVLASTKFAAKELERSGSTMKGTDVISDQPDTIEGMQSESEFEVQIRDVPIANIVDVKATRERLGKTQQEFADSFGLSISSLRNWEQGVRVPERPVALYLRLIDRFPAEVEAEISRLKRKR